MSDILAQICADKRIHIAESKEQRSLAELESVVKDKSAPRGFTAALARAAGNGGLALIAGQAWEIGRRHAGAVVTLRMRGIPGDCGQAAVPVPKGKHLQFGIDRAGGEGADHRAAARAGAHVLHLAVRAEYATVRSHLLDDALTYAVVRCRLGLIQRFANGLARIADDLARVIDIKCGAGDAVRPKHGVGRKIATRRVMLMQGVNSDAVRRCARGLRESFLEFPLSPGTDPDPIHRAKHDRLALTGQHHAPATQGHIVSLHGIIGQRTANGRRGIHVKDGHLNSLRTYYIKIRFYGTSIGIVLLPTTNNQQTYQNRNQCFHC